MTKQNFKTVDMLSLQVGTRQGGALANLIRNPNGSQGAWGWITPPADVAISASYLDGGNSTDIGFSSTMLTFTASGPSGVIAYFTSEPAACAAGQYVMAEFRIRNVFGSGRAGEISVVFYDSVGAVISRAGVKAIASGTAANTVIRLTAPVLAPAGTTKVALRLDALAGTAGPRTLQADRAYLAVGATSAAVASAAYIDPPIVWTDILTPAHEITVDRAALTVGTLVASLRDTSLDPAVNALLRPGAPVRLLARSATGAGALYAGFSQPLFVGTIARAATSYDLTHPIASERALVQITATDALAVLANMRQPVGVGTMADLRYLLEGCGVPWLVNATNNNVPGVPVLVSRNENASVVDQIATTRDTKLGHAWVDRYGVINACDPAYLPAAPYATLAEPNYRHDLNIDFDTSRCINVVTVKRLALTPTGETVETIFGPYVDQPSVATWGSFAEEFTVQGLADAAIPGYAASILAANAVPTRRVNRLAIPITDNVHFADGDWTVAGVQYRVHLDLQHQVTVTNTRGAVSATLRVASVKHTITPEKWIAEFGFASTGGVALPSPAPTVATKQVTNPFFVPAPPATHYGGLTIWRDGRVITVAVNNAPISAQPAGFTLGTVPIGYRPPVAVYCTLYDGPTGALHLAVIDTAGNISRIVGASSAGGGSLGTFTYQTNV